MPSPQSVAVRLHYAALEKSNGVAVSYRRNGEAIDGVVSVPGRTLHDDCGDDGASITARTADWIVDPAKLTLGGAAIQPQRGDGIDWIDEQNVKRSFDVAPSADDRCWRFTDSTRQRIRIHSVEVSPV